MFFLHICLFPSKFVLSNVAIVTWFNDKKLFYSNLKISTYFFFYYTYLISFCSLFKLLWYWHELWHTKSENIHMYIIIQPWINVKKIINNSDCFFITVWNNFCWNLLYCMYPTIYICKSLLIIFVIFFLDLYGRAYWSQLIPWMR